MRQTRPLTRNQQLENAAFLRALRRTGNVALAVREAGAGYGAMQYRRNNFPAFATRWAAALVFAQARLRGGGGTPAKDADHALRTTGGEPVMVRLASVTIQLRRAHPGLVTKAAEQGFLQALAATANIMLSAAAVGVRRRCFTGGGRAIRRSRARCGSRSPRGWRGCARR